MKCQVCQCVTRVDDYCQWCGKPILANTRQPTEQEQDTQTGNTKRRNRVVDVYHLGREPYMDRLLRETRMYIKAERITAAEFNSRVGLAAIVRQLEFGSSLKESSRRKLEKLLGLNRP